MHKFCTINGKINAYMPLVLFPICTYNTFEQEYLWGALFIFVWRTIVYFELPFLTGLLNYRYSKIIAFFMVILMNLVLPNIELKVIANSLCYSLLFKYREFCEVKLKPIANNICILLGMILCGIVPIPILNFYIAFSILLYLFCARNKTEQQEMLCDKKAIMNVDLACIVFLHNFHYYVFAFAIALLPLENLNLKILSGLFCAINWVMFLIKGICVRMLQKNISLNKIIFLGFLMSAFFVFGIALNITNIEILIIVILLQGLFSGVAECFFDMNEFKLASKQYWNIWKVGGLLGTLFGGICAEIFGLESIFILSSIFGIIGSVFSLKWKI